MNLQEIYSYADEVFNNGKFKEFDEFLLNEIEIIDFRSTDEILAILIASNWAKSKLENREIFVKKATTIITQREPEQFLDILKGLV